MSPAIMDLRMTSSQELVERCDELSQTLDEWKGKVVGEHPTEWDKFRTKFWQAQATVDNARDGDFSTATGHLLEFLREAGLEPDERKAD
ncbi:MAG: hypothetical protein AAGC55_08855 [Myxococcota bacterium]